jgi:hypothetical protein
MRTKNFAHGPLSHLTDFSVAPARALNVLNRRPPPRVVHAQALVASSLCNTSPVLPGFNLCLDAKAISCLRVSYFVESHTMPSCEHVTQWLNLASLDAASGPANAVDVDNDSDDDGQGMPSRL